MLDELLLERRDPRTRPHHDWRRLEGGLHLQAHDVAGLPAEGSYEGADLQGAVAHGLHALSGGLPRQGLLQVLHSQRVSGQVWREGHRGEHQHLQLSERLCRYDERNRRPGCSPSCGGSRGRWRHGRIFFML